MVANTVGASFTASVRHACLFGGRWGVRSNFGLVCLIGDLSLQPLLMWLKVLDRSLNHDRFDGGNDGLGGNQLQGRPDKHLCSLAPCDPGPADQRPLNRDRSDEIDGQGASDGEFIADQ